MAETTAAQRYAQGSAAFNTGKSLSANPFPGALAWEWSEGWLHASKAQEARENGAAASEPCADCDDVGLTIQTERWCSCVAGMRLRAAEIGDCYE